MDAELVALRWRRDVTIEKKQWKPSRSQPQPGPNARNVQEHREPYTVDHAEWRAEKQYVNGQAQRIRRQVTRQEIKIRKIYTYEVPVWRPDRTIAVSGEGQTGVR